MTEPRDEGETAPTIPEPAAEPALQPAPEFAPVSEPATPISEPAPTPEPPPTGPPPPVPPEWLTPDAGGSGGGRRRGCLIAVIVLGVVVILGFVGLVFLGSQARNILGGTVQFGTGGTGCSVTGAAATFPASASIRSVALLKEDAPAGTTITNIATFPDGTVDSTDQVVEQAASCITQEIATGLPPGHYLLEYRIGTETVAKGGFDITP